MVLTTMKSKHPEDQITEFKQSQNCSGLVQDIQIYNVSYKTLLWNTAYHAPLTFYCKYQSYSARSSVQTSASHELSHTQFPHK